MANGYMGKMLRVKLSEGKIEEESLREDWAQKFIGGAGLATRYLYEEVPAGADPLAHRRPNCGSELVRRPRQEPSSGHPLNRRARAARARLVL